MPNALYERLLPRPSESSPSRSRVLKKPDSAAGRNCKDEPATTNFVDFPVLLGMSIFYAIPKNTANARSTATNVSCCNFPMIDPTLSRGTVCTLSTMT